MGFPGDKKGSGMECICLVFFLKFLHGRESWACLLFMEKWALNYDDFTKIVKNQGKAAGYESWYLAYSPPQFSVKT